MPTLEVQLAKAEKDIVDLEKVMKIGPGWTYWYRKRADQEHGNEAQLRGLRERVGYLQQKIAVRDERIAQGELRAAAKALVKLAEEWIQTYEPIDLPTHTSEPTAPA